MRSFQSFVKTREELEVGNLCADNLRVNKLI